MNLNLLADNYLTLVDNFLESPAYQITSFFIDVAIWLLGHVFLSIAVYVMAKKNGYKKLWLSFIPFFNLIPLGAVVGKTIVWGLNIKNVGLWVCITGLVSWVIGALLNIGYYIDIIGLLFKVNITFTNEFIATWIAGENLAWLITFYVSGILDLAYIFFEVSFIFVVFRLYRPQSALLYALFSLFFNPPMFGILLFVCRNNPKHVIIRPQQPNGYYGGYYGGYYNNSQRPQNYNNAEESKKQAEDPFPEFNGGEDNSNGSSDDLFD